MGNSYLWYMPTGADRMALIDFGRQCLITRGPTTTYHQSVQESLSGVQSTVIYSGGARISLGHTWNRGTRDASGDGDLLRRKLGNLVSHLQRGGTCVFALDSTMARAGFAVHLPQSEAASIHVEVDLFKNLNLSGSVVTGREVMVQSDHDHYLHEHKLCSLQVGKTFTLTQRLGIDMTREKWCLVREFSTYPALRLPKEFRESGDFLVHDHEMTFHLDLPLEEDPAQMDAYHAFGLPISGTGPGPTTTDIDLGEIPGGAQTQPYEWKG